MNDDHPTDNIVDLENTVKEMMARLTTVESQSKAQSEEMRTLRAEKEEFKTDKAKQEEKDTKQEERNDNLSLVLTNLRPKTKSKRP